jgi:hypothetical protein
MTSPDWLYSAAILSFLVLMAHIFGGGRTIARPLLDSDLAEVPKYASYYCWHMVTIIILYMTISFTLSASDLASTDLAWGSSILAILFAAWSFFLCLWKKQGLLKLPQWIMFLPIAVTGVLGVI